ncbi:MAG TPA: FHA domain-containing protein [Gemmataceae bacterium]|nr:FHA domain-containing protein [Gemmataceae bacterium]
MSAQVILTATHGDLEGREFAFDEPATCVIGRCIDCQVRPPGDDWTVSRHHCLLEVDPPLVRVQDLGSLNGSYVNGEMVGQRDRAVRPDEAARLVQPVVELLDGDELRVGNTCFRVAVLLTPPEGAEPVPAGCAGHSDGPPDRDEFLYAPGL